MRLAHLFENSRVKFWIFFFIFVTWFVLPSGRRQKILMSARVNAGASSLSWMLPPWAYKNTAANNAKNPSVWHYSRAWKATADFILYRELFVVVDVPPQCAQKQAWTIASPAAGYCALKNNGRLQIVFNFVVTAPVGSAFSESCIVSFFFFFRRIDRLYTVQLDIHTRVKNA